MHVAILSNGPSVHLFDHAKRDGYDTLIAVNEAATLWRSKWWVLIDWQAFERIKSVRGEPKLFTRVSTPQLVRENADPEAIGRMEAMLWSGRIMLHEHVPRPPLAEGTPSWNCYSGTAALILAWHLRAESIDVYGADLGGENDCIDVKKAHMRRRERWTHERRIWEGIVTMFSLSGIALRRITNDNQPIRA